jgi:hypothetical protein
VQKDADNQSATLRKPSHYGEMVRILATKQVSRLHQAFTIGVERMLNDPACLARLCRNSIWLQLYRQPAVKALRGESVAHTMLQASRLLVGQNGLRLFIEARENAISDQRTFSLATQ